MNRDEEAKEAIDPIIDLAVRYDYKRRLGQIYIILGAYYFYIEENLSESIRILEKAMKLAEETQDMVTYVLGNFFLGIVSATNVEFKKSLNYFQRAIDINVTVKNLWGTATMKSSLAFHGLIGSGRCDLGFQISGEAVQLADESGDIYSQAIAYGGHGVSCSALEWKYEIYSRRFILGARGSQKVERAF